MKPYAKPNGVYNVALYIDGKQRVRSLQTTDKKVAQSLCQKIAATLADYKRRKLLRPDGCEDANAFADYLVYGRSKQTIESQTTGKTLPEYAAAWLIEVGDKPLIHHHFDLFIKYFGDTRLELIDLQAMQGYADWRRKKGVERDTIKRELDSLRTMWRRFHEKKLIATPYPMLRLGQLKLPEKKRKYPYIPFSVAVDQAKGITKKQNKDFWHSVFLTTEELQDFFITIIPNCSRLAKQNPTFDFLFPSILAVASTGMRRIEVSRSRRNDWLLNHGIAHIRDRKISADGSIINRSAPIDGYLVDVMTDYLASHKHDAAFYSVGCMEDGKDGSCISGDKLQEGFRAAVYKTKYANLSGWHTLRHSFISILTMAGKDDRFIDTIVGHRTEEQRMRYSHLAPKATSIDSILQLRPTIAAKSV